MMLLCRDCRSHAGECCDSWWLCLTNQLHDCKLAMVCGQECHAFIGRDLCG